MIDATSPIFPNNVVSILSTRLATLDPDLRVYSRPLRDSDARQSVGVFPRDWMPVLDSFEMKAVPTPATEPTLSTYIIMIQAFVKDFDEIHGQAAHSVLSKMIRAMLYRDVPLRVGLAALSVSLSGSVETAKRYGIRRQDFLSNEINEDFLYLSTLEFWLETETV